MHLRKPAKPTLFRKFKLLFISMASFFTLTIFSLILFFSISSAARHHSSTSPSISLQIRGACKASRDPPTCESVLTDSGYLPSELTTSLIIQSAVKVSSKNNDKAKEMVQAIIDASTGNNQNRTDAGKVCMEVLGYAEYRVGLTGQAVINGGYKSARAWMSSVMVYQYDCWSALKYVNGTSQVSKTMSFINSLIGYSSNALGMMVNFDLYGADTGSWTVPKTERDGFWEGSGSGSSGSGQVKGGVPTGLKPDVTVCKEGGCDYKTVQEAVNAAPEKEQTRKFVIWIKSGLYEEKVRVGLEKMNVVFLGDGMGKTVITGSLSVGLAGVTTYETATVGVVGDGFMASGITFQNTAGPDAHQAVAFRSDSDLSAVENCEFIGNQDTLYAHALRQYYKSCRIQGNVDFIFGNSASFFQDCDILIAPRQLRPEKGETNAVTAHGRIDPAQSTGFVFQNCLINGTDKYMTLYYNKPKVHKNFLGRPWKEYSRTVFLCHKKGLVELGAKWFHMMLENGVQPNIATFGMLMALYQKGWHVEEAEFTFSMMRNLKIMCQSAYSSMLTIYTRMRLYDKAEEIIGFLRKDEVILNLENWLVLLNAYCQQGKLLEAEQVLASMNQAGFSPNIVAYNTLITGYGKISNMRDAQRLFGDIKRVGMEPDETTYRSMIEGWGRADNYEEANRYYAELKRLGHKPNSSNLYTMLNLQVKHGDEEDVVRTIEEMMHTGGEKSTILGILLQAYEKLELIHEVPSILRGSLYDHVLRNQISCSSLVMVYVKTA